MKLNRIPALAAFAVAAMLIVGQFVGAQAAPSAQPAAHFQASGISAHGSTPSLAASKGQVRTGQPADQSPLDFTVQGRLTNHNGNPITSPTNVVFNLYSVASGGTAELTQSASVTPNANGLFTYVFVVDTSSNFNNVQLFDSKQYLGITVGSDAEMTPRLELTASPYAMSLAPGAEVIGNVDYGLNTNHGLLNLFNTNTTNLNSAGLYASGSTGVWGVARSNTGGSSWGGYFDNVNNDAGSSQYGVGVYAANGWGLYSVSGGVGSVQDSIGVVGQSTAANGIGGVFTGTTYGGVFHAANGIGVQVSSSSTGNTIGSGGNFDNFNYGGGSGTQYGISAFTNSSGTATGYGGSFINNGGGSGTQYGIFASTSTSGVAGGIGGYFDNIGGGSGYQTGVYAYSPGYGLYAGSTASTTSQQSAGVVGQSTAANGIGGVFTGTTGVVVSGTNGTGLRVTASSSGGVNGYGGSFTNNGGGSGQQIGIYSYAPTTGGSLGYSGYFNSNSNTATAVDVIGKVTATGGCCASPNYDTQVQYHGSVPLHLGDVVVMDGNNTTVDGTPTLGVVKADASNADAAIGVVQYRFKAIGKEEKSGRTDWQVDETTTSFQSGDLLSCVFAGQVPMKVAGQTHIGSRVALATDGSISVAAAGADNIIGKVGSAPDKNGYVTVFITLK